MCRADASSRLPSGLAVSIALSGRPSSPSTRWSGFFRTAPGPSRWRRGSRHADAAVPVAVEQRERPLVELEPLRRAGQGDPELLVELVEAAMSSPLSIRT